MNRTLRRPTGAELEKSRSMGLWLEADSIRLRDGVPYASLRAGTHRIELECTTGGQHRIGRDKNGDWAIYAPDADILTSGHDLDEIAEVAVTLADDGHIPKGSLAGLLGQIDFF